jgi:cytochrome c556
MLRQLWSCLMFCGSCEQIQGEKPVNLSKLPIIAAALLGLGPTSAFASGDDTIKARQACMKAQGAAVFGLFFPIMKGEKPYDAAGVKTAYDAMEAACADWNNFWTEDSMTSTTLKTKIKPEILTDKAGFDQVSNAAYEAITALGKTSDEAGFKAALPAVGAACQGCHEKFRLPMD